MPESTRWRGQRNLGSLEMRIHKRLLELVIGKSTDESALRQVMRIPIPDTVTIELSLRTVA